MSAKKVSKMCIFVHKLVEIARFSPRKVQKRGFFAGGRGDFLAGQKRGFLGSAGSRRRARASPVFVHVSLKRKRPSCSHDTKIELKHLRFIPPNIVNDNIRRIIRVRCSTNALWTQN